MDNKYNFWFNNSKLFETMLLFLFKNFVNSLYFSSIFFIISNFKLFLINSRNCSLSISFFLLYLNSFKNILSIFLIVYQKYSLEWFEESTNKEQFEQNPILLLFCSIWIWYKICQKIIYWAIINTTITLI